MMVELRDVTQAYPQSKSRLIREKIRVIGDKGYCLNPSLLSNDTLTFSMIPQVPKKYNLVRHEETIPAIKLRNSIPSCLRLKKRHWSRPQIRKRSLTGRHVNNICRGP
jgi:hypothetical protein